ncbi:MAG: hypothetical protein ABIA37_01635 [Candidatus Woesearchaeota archaeon]
MPFLVFGAEAKLKKDDNIAVDIFCPSCLNAEMFLVLFEKAPSLFWIPVKALSYSEGAGFYCRHCQKIYPIEEELKKPVEDYYSKKISKKELKHKVKTVLG